jgi:hypothetical protein
MYDRVGGDDSTSPFQDIVKHPKIVYNCIQCKVIIDFDQHTSAPMPDDNHRRQMLSVYSLQYTILVQYSYIAIAIAIAYIGDVFLVNPGDIYHF